MNADRTKRGPSPRSSLTAQPLRQAALVHRTTRLVVEFWLALASAAIVCGRLIRRTRGRYRWDSHLSRRP